MPAISIIVPVYNVEQYLPRCLDSIIVQSFPDWECVLIDDGSKDDSGTICDEYAEKDKRFKVFHKENGGVSTARNVGIEKSKGEWITFVDADDYIGNNFLIEFVTSINDNPSLILLTAFYTIQKGDTLLPPKRYSLPDKQSSKEYLECLLSRDRVRIEVWGKLFKRSSLNSIRFSENLKIGEDWFFLISYARENHGFIKNISFSSYYYVIREDSAMRVIGNEIIQAEQMICELIKSDDEIYKYCFNSYLIAKNINSIRNAVLNSQEPKWTTAVNIHNFSKKHLRRIHLIVFYLSKVSVCMTLYIITKLTNYKIL